MSSLNWIAGDQAYSRGYTGNGSHGEGGATRGMTVVEYLYDLYNRSTPNTITVYTGNFGEWENLYFVEGSDKNITGIGVNSRYNKMAPRETKSNSSGWSIPTIDFDIDFGVGPNAGFKILGVPVEVNLAKFSIFNRKYSYQDGKIITSASSIYQKGQVTQSIGAVIIQFENKQVVGDPDAEVSSFKFLNMKEETNSDGKNSGAHPDYSWGASFIFSVDFNLSIHY